MPCGGELWDVKDILLAGLETTSIQPRMRATPMIADSRDVQRDVIMAF
jgi:hypothetical protein